MKKIITVLVLALTVLSCSKDEGEKDFDTEYSAVFEGVFTNYSSPSDMEGTVEVDTNGKITIQFFAGKLVGTAEKTDEGYDILITQVSGVFQNIDDISGSLNTSFKTLSVSGTNLDGSPVNITGQVQVQTTGGWENLSKTAVNFTHNQEGCLASVTIDGVTLSGLNKHYEGGYCNPSYVGVTNFLMNYDDNESQIFCYTGTLQGAGGNPVTFTDCSVIQFILNKNSQYTYTVNWSNGDTSTGQFTTQGGGSNLPICLSSTNSCSGGGTNGSIQFNLEGTNYDMDVLTQGDDPDCASSHSVFYQETNANVIPSILINNMPSQSSGSYQLDDDSNECNHYIAINMPSCGVSLLSQSGTITKTGAKSFTFTAMVYNDCTSQTLTVSGSGSY